MKYLIMYAMLVAAFSLNLMAAEPIVPAPLMPQKDELEMYEDSEGLFALKMMEFYKTSVVLETQLRFMGLKSTTPVFAPTSEELQDMDAKTLVKFYRMAANVYSQVQGAPEGLYNEKIESLRLTVDKLNNENFQLKDSLFKMNLVNNQTEYYKSQYAMLIAIADSLNILMDKNYLEYKNETWKRENAIRQTYDNTAYTIPILTGSVTANSFDYKNSDIESNIAPGFIINFNPGPVLYRKLGGLFDIWGEYVYSIATPKKTDNFPFNSDNYTEFWSYGLNLNIPISKMLDFNKMYLGAKIGAGFFSANSEAPNTKYGSTKWHGEMVHLEFNASDMNALIPLGFFVSYDFYNCEKDMQFATAGRTVNLGKPWINNFQLGLKVFLWRSSFIND